MRVADVDDDGDPDVIAAAKNGNLVGWWNNDAPSLGSIYNDAHATEIWSPNPKAVHPALVDDDGYLDLVVAEFNSSAITADILLFATGGRGPADWLSQVVESGFSYARSVSSADRDRDGDVDLIGAGDNTLAGWEATGSGWTRHDITTACTQAQSVQVADLDRDGDQDVVAACSGLAAGTAQVKAYENDGSPANGGWTAHSPGPNQYATEVVVADVTRDGRPDLVVADDDSVVLAVHLATDFSFTNRQIVDYLEGDGNQVEAVDIDDDGDLDILVGEHDTGTWTEFRQPADGWSGVWTSKDHVAVASSISGLRATDVDLDGGYDVVFTSDLDSAVLFSDRSIPITEAIATGVQFPQSPEVADLDSDGDLDIVAVAGGATSRVLVFWNPRGLFTDGFESGSSGGWSSVGP